MQINLLAGKPAEPSMLANIPKLITAYYTQVPSLSEPRQKVAFGTSGHRGCAFDTTFNQWHALSIPAAASALEVLAANGVEVMLAENDEYTPTPAISHAILKYNRGRKKVWPMASS